MFDENREKWDYVHSDDTAVKSLAEQLDVPLIIAEVLQARQIGNGDQSVIENFISPQESLLEDPHLLSTEEDLSIAHHRLQKAIQNRELIFINGDPDADGITGATILVSGLRQLGAQVDYDFPVRSREGHGLQIRIIDKAIAQGASVIITVDCGSQDYQATEYANEKGLDVIICDHHKLTDSPPKALAIINPKRLDPDSDLSKLAGAGVSYLFIVSLFHLFNKELTPEYLDYFLYGISRKGWRSYEIDWERYNVFSV